MDPLAPKRPFLLQNLSIDSPATSTGVRVHPLDAPFGDFKSEIPDAPIKKAGSYSTPPRPSSGLSHGEASPFKPLSSPFQPMEKGSFIRAKAESLSIGKGNHTHSTSHRQVPVTVLSRDGDSTLLPSMMLLDPVAASNDPTTPSKSPFMNSPLLRSLDHEDRFSPIPSPMILSTSSNAPPPTEPGPLPEIALAPRLCPLPDIALSARNHRVEPKYEEYRLKYASSDSKCDDLCDKDVLGGFDNLIKKLSASASSVKHKEARKRHLPLTRRLNPIKHELDQHDDTEQDVYMEGRPSPGNGMDRDDNSFLLGLPLESGKASKRFVSFGEEVHDTSVKLTFPMAQLPRLPSPSSTTSTQDGGLYGLSLFPDRSELSLHSLALSMDSDAAYFDNRDFTSPPLALSSPGYNNDDCRALRSPPMFLPQRH